MMITDKEASDGESDSRDPTKPLDDSNKPDDDDDDNNEEAVESESGSEYEVVRKWIGVALKSL